MSAFFFILCFLRFKEGVNGRRRERESEGMTGLNSGVLFKVSKTK